MLNFFVECNCELICWVKALHLDIFIDSMHFAMPNLVDLQIRSPETFACSKLKLRKLRKKALDAKDNGIVVASQHFGCKLAQSLYQHHKDGYV